jgi:hypothetical protein
MTTPYLWLLKVIAILIGIVLPLGAAEVWLRLTGFSYPIFFNANPVTGNMHRPYVEGWYREEGEAYVTINSVGLRDREHTTAKPAGVVRMLVLGDSYAEALQVPVEQTFWAVLERELNACHAFGQNVVEAINLGVSGYGTAQELLALRTWGWAYQPDIVLLAFLTGNDISDNSKELNNLSSTPRPYFIKAGTDLVLDQSFLSTTTYKQKTGKMWTLFQSLSDEIRLLQFFYRAKHRLQQEQQDKSAAVMIGLPAVEVGLDDSIYGEPIQQTWKVAWEITERLLLTIREESRSRGARFILATLSNGIQVLPNPQKRESLVRQLQLRDLFYPDTRLHHLADREGFEVITLAQALQQHAETHQEILHGFDNAVMGFGHWNERGHQVAGQHLARYFCADSNRTGISSR